MAVIGLNAIGQMFFIHAYPLWSLMIIAVDVAAVYGLCACGSRENWPLTRAPSVSDSGEAAMAKQDKNTLYVIVAAYDDVDAAVADYEAVNEPEQRSHATACSG